MLQTDNHHFKNQMNFQIKKTPNRNRPPAFNHQIRNVQYNSREDIRSLSPNKLNATKKPMIGGPQRNNILMNKNQFPPNYPTQRNQRGIQNLTNNYRSNNFEPSCFARCENHPAKAADFTAFIQGQKLTYCQKCAINVASNGFQVSKLNSQSPKNNKNGNGNKYFLGSPKSQLQPFNFPEFSSQKGYNELKNIVTQIDGVHCRYQEQLKVFTSVEQHYERQFNLTQSFYEDLLKTIQQMKQDHLNDLVDMSKKHIQLAYIKEDHLKNDMEEMEVIRNDIINSLQIILQHFEDPETEKNLGFYKQQIYSYSDKIDEEKADFEGQIIFYKPEQMDYRLNLLQEYLLDVWEIKPNQQQTERRQNNNNFNSVRQNQYSGRSQQKQTNKVPKSPMNNIIHIGNHPNQPKKQQTGTACRRLFDDDDNEKQFIAQQTSPQFKAI